MTKQYTLNTLSIIVLSGLLLSCSFDVDDLIGAKKLFSTQKQRYAAPEIESIPVGGLDPRKVELGKTLFFDPRLSGSNWISCATCHNPSMGWSDGLPKAIGQGQNTLSRATPTIINVAYNFLQTWDGRFNSLEEQALSPIESPMEMNQDLDDLVAELNNISGYVQMFYQAFPRQGISKETIAQALASFERQITAADAPFDLWINGDENAISYAAKQGFKLFEGKAHCSTCHAGYNFSDDGFHNIGIKSDDVGRFNVVPLAVTKGAFKTPTLRDIGKTAPYMHNGAYKTLDEVIDHYIRGGEDKSNLSANFKKADLNKKEKAELLAFLKTLDSKSRPTKIPRLPIQANNGT